MKNQEFKKYIYYGVTAVLVIAVCIVFGYCIIERRTIAEGFSLLGGILAPVIYGAVFAYLLTPVYNHCLKFVERVLARTGADKSVVKSISRLVGTVVSLIVIIFVIAGLFQMIIPQIISSILGIKETMPANIEKFSHRLQQMLADNPDVEAYVMEFYNQVSIKFRDWLSNFDMMSNLEVIVTSLSNGVISVVVWIKNLLIGLIVMVYLLNMKDLLVAQAKKVVYGCFTIKWANIIVDEMRYVHQVFGGFIIGKLLDSLIIGILCFFCLGLMNMPYTLLISVIIGVTNVIPFFGPFIGAIPTAFLVLLVSPIKCLYFLLFILLLQQFDGNILGPKILGDSTGLSSFWVLFSILLFGGLFGFVGMIIGVPTFAVIYDLIKKAVEHSLKTKELSKQTSDYMELNHIDEEKKTYIK